MRPRRVIGHHADPNKGMPSPGWVELMPSTPPETCSWCETPLTARGGVVVCRRCDLLEAA